MAKICSYCELENCFRVKMPATIVGLPQTAPPPKAVATCQSLTNPLERRYDVNRSHGLSLASGWRCSIRNRGLFDYNLRHNGQQLVHAFRRQTVPRGSKPRRRTNPASTEDTCCQRRLHGVEYCSVILHHDDDSWVCVRACVQVLQAYSHGLSSAHRWRYHYLLPLLCIITTVSSASSSS